MGRVVGVVGCGYWGRNLIRVLCNRTDTEVVVIDERPGVLAEIEAHYPNVVTALSLESVASSLYAVAIATPPATHAALVQTALRSGCHVFVEKPFTTRLDDARGLARLACSLRLTLMVGHTYDYHSAVTVLANMVANGDLGMISYLDSARLAVGGYRSDVNVLWDMAPHDLVIMRRLLNAWPSTVSAWASNHGGTKQADVGLLRLEFPHTSTIGYVRVSWLDPIRVRRFTAVGTERTALFNELANPSLRIIDTRSEPRLGAGSVHPLPGGYPDELITFPAFPAAEPLRNEVDHFMACAATGATPRSDAVEGAAVVAVLEAAERSLLSGRPEQVDREVGALVEATV